MLGDGDRRPQVELEEKNVEKGKESVKDPLRDRGCSSVWCGGDDERGNENLQMLEDHLFSSLAVDRGIGIGAEGGGVGRGVSTERKAFMTVEGTRLLIAGVTCSRRQVASVVSSVT